MSNSLISKSLLANAITVRFLVGDESNVCLYIKGRLGFRLVSLTSWIARGALRLSTGLNNMCQLEVNSLYEKRFSNFIKEIINSLETGWFLEFKLVGLAAKVIIFKRRKVVLELGHTHWDIFNIPAGVRIWVKKRRIVVRALTKNLLSDFVIKLMKIKGPTPYKLRGVVLSTKVYKLKPGKKK